MKSVVNGSKLANEIQNNRVQSYQWEQLLALLLLGQVFESSQEILSFRSSLQKTHTYIPANQCRHFDSCKKLKERRFFSNTMNGYNGRKRSSRFEEYPFKSQSWIIQMCLSIIQSNFSRIIYDLRITKRRKGLKKPQKN